MQPDPTRTLPHAELMLLPVVRYEGNVQLVSSERELRHALDHLLHERVLGFDTETRPTFRKGQTHKPSLVQLAAQDVVYLFQLKQLDCSPVLAEILGDRQVIKAGVALARDLSELQKLFPFKPENVLDLGDVAKKHGLKQTGLRNLAGMFLGQRIVKSSQTSNWAQPRLTAAQIRYAATDAWVCRELYLRFESFGWIT